MIHAYASQQHYARHLIPIHDALPDEVRGSFAYVPEEVMSGPVMVASWADAHRMAARDLIYVEHGAGQSYAGAAESHHYAGGASVAYGSVRLFVCPSARVAARWREIYPDTPSVVVGCPALDRWLPDPPDPEPRTWAFSFHYDAHRVCPEARSAFPHYRDQLPATIHQLQEAGWTVVGHAHPRALELGPFWRSLNIPEATLDQVLTRATVLAVDNSSILYEMAALGRMTVALNAPWYRREVEHGLRFWSHIPDAMIDDLGDLEYTGMARAPEHRLAVARDVYAYLDGRSSERAARAIIETLT